MFKIRDKGNKGQTIKKCKCKSKFKKGKLKDYSIIVLNDFN